MSGFTDLELARINSLMAVEGWRVTLKRFNAGEPIIEELMTSKKTMRKAVSTYTSLLRKEFNRKEKERTKIV